MKNSYIILFLILSLIAETNFSYSQTTPVPADEAATGTWQMIRGSRRHMGTQLMRGKLNATPNLKWQYMGPGQSGKGGGEGEPVIGDVNSDGQNDVVAANGGTLFVINGSTGALVWQSANGGNQGSQAIADINSNGSMEVVAGGQNALYALNGNNGSVLWSHSPPAVGGLGVISSAAVGDVDGNGSVEVVYSASNKIFALNGTNGSVLWQFTTTNGGDNLCSPAIGDITGDGKPEVVCAGPGDVFTPATIYALNGATGAVVWSYKFPSGFLLWSSPALGDLNGDCVQDVTMVGPDNKLYAWRGTNGTILWSVSAGGMGAPAIDDINGDCIMEVLLGTNNMTAYRGSNGSTLWSVALTPAGGSPGWHAGAPKIGDFNSNVTGKEIVIGTSYDSTSNRIYMVSSTGTVLWSYRLAGHTYEGSSVGDIDNDGCVEIVASPDCCNGTSSIIALDDVANSTACGIMPTPTQVDFTGDTLLCPSQCASFGDWSTTCVTSWEWTFQGATPGTSTQKDPTNICYSGAGTYDVRLIATLNGGCSKDTSIHKITVQASCGPPTVEITGGYVCPGGCVNITATGTGGGTPYTYAWSPAGPGNSAGPYNACPGATTTYTVTLTDKTGLTATDTAVVTVNPALNVSGTKTDIACSGSNNGSGTATPSGGTSPYTYVWSPSGGTGSTANNLSAGTYTITTTDNRGCSQTATVTITAPTAISTTSAKTDVNCGGGNNGTATVTPSGGTSPYTYAWSPSGGTGATANTLTAGIYTVTVTDNKGCTRTATAQITEPTAVTANTTKADVTCNAGTNGTATVTAGGGTSPFTYTWSPSGGTGSTANTLSTGIYTVTVTDNKGCTQTATAQITEPAAVNLTTGNTPAQCGQSDGAATVTPAGGTTPYTYSWSNGGVSNTISNVSGATYTVTVTDNKGCTITTTVAVPSTGATTASITTSTNVSCNGGNNGSATASGGGGQSPFTYTWSNGGSGTSVSSLTSGTYTITVTDATGCPATASVTITAPNAINLVTGKTDANCGGSDGTASVTPSGGAGAPFTYSWSTGAVTGTVNGISQGTYTVTVTDVNGCTNTTTVTVNDIGSPQLTTSSNSVKCNGASTGTISSTVTGGVSPYTYTWSSGQSTPNLNNISAGTYTLTVTGQNGCKATEVINISEPVALSTTTGKTDANCGKSDGSATVTATGGTSPYQYLWSGGGTATIKSAAPAGTYTVTITDANGCTTTATESIADIGAPSVNAVKTDVQCFGAVSGTATATPTGGILPYTYTWSNGMNTDIINNVAAGTYTVTVTGNNGCTVTTTVTVNQPADMTLAINNTSELCGSGNGSATVTANGGTGTYSYLWSGVSGSGLQVSGLSQGAYTVTVTDANGCTKVISTSVGNISDYGPKALFTVNPTVTEILAPTVNFYDQTGGLTAWSWDFGDGTTDSIQNPVHIYKDTGTYTACLSITNQYGCSSQSCLPVTIKPIWSVYIPNAFTPDGDGKNDFFGAKGEGLKTFELYIFDRWGDLQFKSDNITKMWDGRANDGADIVEEDVYVYLVMAVDVFGKKHRYTGSVTVLK